MTQRGKVIVIDGPEGAGKTTVAQKIADRFGKERMLYAREPGGTVLGDEVRRILLDPASQMCDLAEFMLFWASRAQLISEVALAIDAGKHVLYDRFIPSTFAYQIRGRGINDVGLFNALVRGVCSRVLPDCYIFLDIDPVIGMARANRRSVSDRIEKEAFDFHHRVYQGYIEFFSMHSHVRVDASKSPDDVFAEVMDVVSVVTNCETSRPA